MNFFKREKNSEPLLLSNSTKPIYKPSAALTGKTASNEDIQSARESVDFLTNEFKMASDQQQLAAKRMASLNKTIAKMEIGLRHVDRLESENKSLN